MCLIVLKCFSFSESFLIPFKKKQKKNNDIKFSYLKYLRNIYNEFIVKLKKNNGDDRSTKFAVSKIILILQNTINDDCYYSKYLNTFHVDFYLN